MRREFLRGIIGSGTLCLIPSVVYSNSNINSNTAVEGGGYVVPIYDSKTLLIPHHMIPKNQRNVRFFTRRAKRNFKIESTQRIPNVDAAIIRLQESQELVQPLELSSKPMKLREEYLLSLKEFHGIRAIREIEYPPKFQEKYRGIICVGRSLTPEVLFKGLSGLPVINSQNQVVGIQSYILQPTEDGLQPTIIANVGGLERYLR